MIGRDVAVLVVLQADPKKWRTLDELAELFGWTDAAGRKKIARAVGALRRFGCVLCRVRRFVGKTRQVREFQAAPVEGAARNALALVRA